jgi:hypothetical protein
LGNIVRFESVERRCPASTDSASAFLAATATAQIDDGPRFASNIGLGFCF